MTFKEVHIPWYDKICDIEGCDRKRGKHSGRGMCYRHYNREILGLDPTKDTIHTQRVAIIEGNIARIPLGKEAKYGYAVVDATDKDVDKVGWTVDRRGYALGHTKERKSIRMHSMVMGKPPEGLEIDHINRDKLDNRRSNLRFVTPKENMANVLFKNRNSSLRMKLEAEGKLLKLNGEG